MAGRHHESAEPVQYLNEVNDHCLHTRPLFSVSRVWVVVIHRHYRRAAVILVCRVAALSSLTLSSLCAAADYVAKGHLHSAGAGFELIDAVGMPYVGDELKLVLSSKSFDRAKLAEDGVLNFLDIMPLRKGKDIALVEIPVQADGKVSCVEIYAQEQTSMNCTGLQVQFTVRNAQRMAGTARWKSGSDTLDARFDVPIQRQLGP